MINISIADTRKMKLFWRKSLTLNKGKASGVCFRLTIKKNTIYLRPKHSSKKIPNLMTLHEKTFLLRKK